MKKTLLFTSLFLVLSIVSMTRIIAHSQIRAVDIVSILGVGMLTGVLIVQLVIFLKNKDSE